MPKEVQRAAAPPTSSSGGEQRVHDEASGLVRRCAAIEEGTDQQEKGDPSGRQGLGAHHDAPRMSRASHVARRDGSFGHGITVRGPQQERAVGHVVARSFVTRPKRNGRDRIRQRELDRPHAGRGRRRREDVLRCNRTHSTRRGRQNRLDVHQPEAERRRGDKEVRGACNAISWEVGGTTRPGARDAAHVVDRNRDVSRAGAVAPSVAQEIEQRALAVFSGIEAAGGCGAVGHLGRHARQRPGHRRKVRLHVRLDPGGGRVVGGTEPPQLGREADGEHDSSSRGASGNQPPPANLPFARKDARHS